MAVLAPISLIGNGFILTVILLNRELRKNDNLFLLVALSLADFFLALFILPYIAYLFIEWDSYENINYDANKMLLFNIPVVCEMKINSVLTVAIAFDRFTALQCPLSHKVKARGLYTAGALAVGIIWAIFDVFFDLETASFVETPGCATAGCFMSEKFRFYWGISNMITNALAMAITVLLMFKIRLIERNNIIAVSPGPSRRFANGSRNKNESNGTNKSKNKISSDKRVQFANANHIALSVLLCSGTCIFVPLVFGGLGEMAGLPAFFGMGPFVEVGLLACGVGNAFIFGLKHRVIRQAIRAIWKKSGEQQDAPRGQLHLKY